MPSLSATTSVRCTCTRAVCNGVVDDALWQVQRVALVEGEGAALHAAQVLVRVRCAALVLLELHFKQLRAVCRTHVRCTGNRCSARGPGLAAL